MKKTTTRVDSSLGPSSPSGGLRQLAAVWGIAITAVAVGSVTADTGTHEAITIQEETFQVGMQGAARNLSEISEYCLGCHGTGATEAPEPTHSVGGDAESHPVDVDYPENLPGYTPRASLDPRLQLVDGQLACTTCHDAKSRDHRLVLPGAGSQLCLACHAR